MASAWSVDVGSDSSPWSEDNLVSGQGVHSTGDITNDVLEQQKMLMSRALWN